MLRVILTWVGVQIAYLVLQGVVGWLVTRPRPSLLLVAGVINAVTLSCLFAIADELRASEITVSSLVYVGLLGYLTVRALVLGWFALVAIRGAEPDTGH
jgi:hypothetical protein